MILRSERGWCQRKNLNQMPRYRAIGLEACRLRLSSRITSSQCTHEGEGDDVGIDIDLLVSGDWTAATVPEPGTVILLGLGYGRTLSRP